MSLLAVVALMGMDMSYARAYLSRQEPNGVPVEVFCWRLILLIATVAAVIGSVGWWWYCSSRSEMNPWLALWVGVGVVGSLLLSMAQTRARLLGDYTRLALAVGFGGVSASLLTVVLAWLLSVGEVALVLGYVSGYLFPLVLLKLPSWRKLTHASGLSASQRRAIWLVGLPGVVTAPMYWVISSADRWFLGAYVDASEVGVYAVAVSLATAGMLLNNALIAIWLPEATRFHEKNVDEGRQYLSVLMSHLILILAWVWLVMTALGGDVLRILTHIRFHRAAVFLPWVAGGVFFYGCYQLFNTSLFLHRRLRWSAVAMAAAGASVLAANAYWVPSYGALASAKIQCLGFAGAALLVLAIAQRIDPLPLPFSRLGAVLLIVMLSGIWLAPAWHQLPWYSAMLKLIPLAIVVILTLLIGAPEFLPRFRSKNNE
ncbi:MAG: hypothetical protein KF686_15075 [Ramlibacter sp.]|nr:hypothetical protein [Ramlibacter sp.]